MTVFLIRVFVRISPAFGKKLGIPESIALACSDALVFPSAFVCGGEEGFAGAALTLSAGGASGRPPGVF